SSHICHTLALCIEHWSPVSSHLSYATRAGAHRHCAAYCSPSHRASHDVSDLCERARGLCPLAARRRRGDPRRARPLLRPLRIRILLLRRRLDDRAGRHRHRVRRRDRGRARRPGTLALAPYEESIAFTESLTFPLSAREIGQLSLAPSAACLNFTASAPGT